MGGYERVDFKAGEFESAEFIKDGEGKFGKWEMFNVIFKCDGKPMKLTAFSPMSKKGLQLDDLEEGVMYSFGYTVSNTTGKNGQEYTNYNLKVVTHLEKAPVTDSIAKINKEKQGVKENRK